MMLVFSEKNFCHKQTSPEFRHLLIYKDGGTAADWGGLDRVSSPDGGRKRTLCKMFHLNLWGIKPSWALFRLSFVKNQANIRLGFIKKMVFFRLGFVKKCYFASDNSYRAEDVKKSLALLCDAGIIKRVSHTAANGLPLGAEVNDKFRKYIYLDSGLLLRMLDMDLGGARQLTELIIAGTAEDLVNKGGLTEMVLGWELEKYNNPRTQHDLYYWENTAEGTRSEVDYIMARDLKVLPIECKSGTSGKMKSMYEFMRQKHLTDAVRCSLENFAIIESQDKQDNNAMRRILILPLFAVSNLFSTL
jgi:hypothetical protein